MPLKSLRRRAAAPALACAAALLLLSCHSGSSRRGPGSIDAGSSAPLVVQCIAGSDTLLAGSAPVLVFGRVTRGNLPVSGASVTFTASRGLAQPPEVITDVEGMATVQYTPPGTAGAARIDLNATDRRIGDSATSSCTMQIISPRDPRLNVQVLIPGQAAGLSVRVQYDPARVDLPLGALRPGGAFAGPGCLPIASDNDLGFAELGIACGTLLSTSGTVATFDFVHVTGPELAAGDFTVSCSAFDEQGRTLAAACATSVTQL